MVAPGAMAPAVAFHPVSISARIGSAWSDRVTASGILGGVLGLLVLLPRLLGVWRGLLLTF